ncbi:hypothetical protein ABEB36_005325 [Hypothenemus hampei]|uniref:Uncharacterized protein n=1 Tax=Hypothenemus hampei TaxID=57062 RepID=A0ABD1F0V7_HYPHA
MFACNCLNIVIHADINEHPVTKEFLGLSDEEQSDLFFNEDQWYTGSLISVSQVHPGLIHTRQQGLWNISHCLNCDVHTHAIHKKKGANHTLIHSKLLNEESINNVKSNDLVSNIFDVIVNPNAIESENVVLNTHHNDRIEATIKEFNEIVSSYIRKEQAVVEEKIKKFSDDQYELLNLLKDKAYKEREALVRIVQKASTEDNFATELSPKSPNLCDLFSPRHVSGNSPSEVPFSPKRPKGDINLEKSIEFSHRDDLIFDFESDDFSESRASFQDQIYESDNDDVEEAEDLISATHSRAIIQGRSSSSSVNIAKSCPVDIPAFSQVVRGKNMGSKIEDDLSPREGDLDIAASIKALAQSVHGDRIFGDLPRPKFSTQI